MTMKLPGIAALSAMLVASPALAQTPAAASLPQVTHGAPIPGLCALSQQAVISNSAVGKSVRDRVVQLEGQVRAEVASTKEALDRDIQAFQTARPTLSAEAVNQQGTALNQRAAQFEQLVETRAQELDATQGKALQRISQEMTPVVTQVYQAHSCAILLDESAVLAMAPQMDITPDVVRGLDARITQIPVEMERATAALPGAAAPAAAPAARR